jgi:hypothetical protein
MLIFSCATPISANNEDSNFSMASDTQETTSDFSTPTNFSNTIINKPAGDISAPGSPPQVELPVMHIN